jgi:hypothetical protein
LLPRHLTGSPFLLRDFHFTQTVHIVFHQLLSCRVSANSDFRSTAKGPLMLTYVNHESGSIKAEWRNVIINNYAFVLRLPDKIEIILSDRLSIAPSTFSSASRPPAVALNNVADADIFARNFTGIRRTAHQHRLRVLDPREVVA